MLSIFQKPSIFIFWCVKFSCSFISPLKQKIPNHHSDKEHVLLFNQISYPKVKHPGILHDGVCRKVLFQNGELPTWKYLLIQEYNTWLSSSLLRKQRLLLLYDESSKNWCAQIDGTSAYLHQIEDHIFRGWSISQYSIQCKIWRWDLANQLKIRKKICASKRVVKRQDYPCQINRKISESLWTTNLLWKKVYQEWCYLLIHKLSGWMLANSLRNHRSLLVYEESVQNNSWGRATDSFHPLRHLKDQFWKSFFLLLQRSLEVKYKLTSWCQALKVSSRQVNKNAELCKSIDELFENGQDIVDSSALKGLTQKTGFETQQILRKYIRYVLNEKPFNGDLVNNLIKLKKALNLDDSQVGGILNEISRRIVKDKGPVVMEMSGYSEKGFKRKLAVQALFGKVYYLSELPEFCSTDSSLIVKEIFGVADEDAEKLRLHTVSEAGDLDSLEKMVGNSDPEASGGDESSNAS